MKDILFDLPNEALEGSGKFCASFFFTYKHGFLFLHICSLQVVSCHP